MSLITAKEWNTGILGKQPPSLIFTLQILLILWHLWYQYLVWNSKLTAGFCPRIKHVQSANFQLLVCNNHPGINHDINNAVLSPKSAKCLEKNSSKRLVTFSVQFDSMTLTAWLLEQKLKYFFRFPQLCLLCLKGRKGDTCKAPPPLDCSPFMAFQHIAYVSQISSKTCKF